MYVCIICSSILRETSITETRRLIIRDTYFKPLFLVRKRLGKYPVCLYLSRPLVSTGSKLLRIVTKAKHTDHSIYGLEARQQRIMRRMMVRPVMPSLRTNMRLKALRGWCVFILYVYRYDIPFLFFHGRLSFIIQSANQSLFLHIDHLCRLSFPRMPKWSMYMGVISWVDHTWAWNRICQNSVDNFDICR